MQTTQEGQFGGFTMGQSRNDNAVSLNVQNNPCVDKSSGWRIWNVNESLGEITLISAGTPESYCNLNVN